MAKLQTTRVTVSVTNLLLNFSLSQIFRKTGIPNPDKVDYKYSKSHSDMTSVALWYSPFRSKCALRWETQCLLSGGWKSAVFRLWEGDQERKRGWGTWCLLKALARKLRASPHGAQSQEAGPQQGSVPRPDRHELRSLGWRWMGAPSLPVTALIRVTQQRRLGFWPRPQHFLWAWSREREFSSFQT